MAKLGLDFPTRWGRRPLARLARAAIQGALMVPYVRRISTLEARGLENLEGTGPFIIAANHASNLDTPLLLSALPAAMRRRTVVAAAMDTFFMSYREAFRTVLVFNAIPIDRHKVNRRSSQLALALVEEGWHLLIYPEGGRTPTGQMQAFKGGAAYLAEHAGALVVPAYIEGAGPLQGPRYAKAPQWASTPSQRHHHVVVAFGPPLRCAEGETIRRFNARIEDAVVAVGREVTGDPTLGISRAGEG
ncbi:MAG: 1-acyl-sn-glycerol-3-phosphate acyltransferase [Acidobacteriota bacterium]|nr:1-acyl-sn-glycerol-3-phosphate acyltransferase [Acidobacteriota bacterium]